MIHPHFEKCGVSCIRNDFDQRYDVHYNDKSYFDSLPSTRCETLWPVSDRATTGAVRDRPEPSRQKLTISEVSP